MQIKKSQNAKNIIQRLKIALKISADVELARVLNIKQNTISTWKKRNSVDYESIIDLCQRENIDLNTIFYESSKEKEYNIVKMVTRNNHYRYATGERNFLDEAPEYRIPFLKGTKKRIFQINSRNMYPTLIENSCVVCKKIDFTEIVNDSVYVIVSFSRGLFINRVLTDPENPDKVYLVNDNSLFIQDNTIMASDEINEIWSVVAVISFLTNDDYKL